jgi:putative FmdB family regulatory protein
MPTYEYECSSCHHRFEKKQRFYAKPEAVCPKCRGKARRIIHPSPIIFKGGGFYVTDSRKGVPDTGGGESSGGKKGKK